MSLRLRAALEGNLETAMARDRTALATGTKKSVAEATNRAKEAARAEVRGAFGKSSFRASAGGFKPRSAGKVANAIRGNIYANADGSASGLVFSKFGRKEGGRFVDYLAPHAEGQTIEGRGGKYLYVPVGNQRKKRIDVSETKGAAFVPAKGGRVIYIVKSTKTRTTLLAILVRRVRLKKSLDFKKVARNADKILAASFIKSLDQVGA